jgi:N4-gp56 family major capsid protein
MATNVAGSFAADIEGYLADETLPLVRRQLVVYQFGDPLTLPKGRGTAYTATRYNRVPLPNAPLAEGVPPIGEQMTISQVSATAQQWGDKITITDVGELTIKHPLFVKATELLGLQIAETLERNTFNNLMAGAQVNYVNSRGSRGALVAGDVLNPHEINRATAMLETLGAPRYSGDEMTDTRLEADAGGAKASSNPRGMPHYVSVLHTLVVADMRENPTINQAWTFSDINRLYNYELGEWGGIRFTRSNLVPTFTGFAAPTGTPVVGGGTFLVGTGYQIIITGSDTQNQYEALISQTSADISVAAGGSISVTMPTTPGYTYNVYVNTGTDAVAPVNLATSPQGPTVGPYAGMAVQLAPGQVVTLTGIGVAQVPPAAPATATGTVYPCFVFGRGAYGQVMLDNTRFTYLKDADKSDPLNQLRVVGWKCFYGTLIENQQFFMRIESTSAFNTTFG